MPFAHSQRLFAAAPGPRRFLAGERASHNDTFAAGGEGRLAALAAFADACLGGAASPAR